MTMNITAWMNMPSPYQSRFFAALARQPGVRLRMIYAYGISEDRAALGWKRIDAGAEYDIVMLGRPGWLHACRLAWQRRHDFQIVNSLWAVPVFTPVRLLHAVAGRGPLLIHSEPSDPTLRRSPIRTRLRNAFARAAALTRRFSVLAISPLAERQYNSLGFDAERVYPFGYFNDALIAPPPPAEGGGRRLVFVGQLIPRKGWRVMFDALTPLWTEFPDLRLEIIGTGPDESAMRLAAERTAGARVHFAGAVDAAGVSGRIAQNDLLVLPSLFDGWGLVVNEALMVGVPVAVSTACGASCLIEAGVDGFTFAPGSPVAMREALRAFLSLDGDGRRAMRGAAVRKSEAVSIETAAAYVVSCFRHAAGQIPAKPAAPWLASRLQN